MTARVIQLLIAAGLACGLVSIVFGAKAADDLSPRWQVMIQRPGEDWQPLTINGRPPWLFVSPTACALDLVGQSYVEPSGTRLACVRTVTR